MTKKLFLVLTLLLAMFSFVFVSCESNMAKPEEGDGQNPDPSVKYAIVIDSDRDTAVANTEVTYTATLTPSLANAVYIWSVNGTVQSETSNTFRYTPTTSGTYTISVKTSFTNEATRTLTVTAPIEKPEDVKGSVWYGYSLNSMELSLKSYHVTSEYNPNTSQEIFEWVEDGEPTTYSIPEVKYVSVEFDEKGNGTLYSVTATPAKETFDTSVKPTGYGTAGDSIRMESSFDSARTVSFADFDKATGNLNYQGIELTQVVGVAGAGLDGTWDIKDIVVPGTLADFYTALLDKMMVQSSKTIQESGIQNAVTIEDVSANGKVKIDGDKLLAKVDADINANFVDDSMSLANIIPSVSLDTNIVVNGGSINIQDTVIPSLPDNSVRYQLSEDGSVLMIFIDLGNSQQFMVPLARSNEELVIKTTGTGSFSGSLTNIDDIWATYDSIAAVLPSSITGKPIASAYGTSGIWSIESVSDTALEEALTGVDSRFMSFENSPIPMGDVYIDTYSGSEGKNVVHINIEKANSEYFSCEFADTAVEKTLDKVILSYTSKYESGSYVTEEGSITFKLDRAFNDMKDYLQTLLSIVDKDYLSNFSLSFDGSKISATYPMDNYDDNHNLISTTKESIDIAQYYVENNTLVTTVDNGLFSSMTLPTGLKFQLSIPVSGKTLILFHGSNGKDAGVVLK